MDSLRVIVFNRHSALVCAQTEGFFEREDLDVHVELTRSSKEQFEGLLEGQYGCAHTAADNVMSRHLDGITDPVVLAIYELGANQTLFGGPKVGSLKDLSGCRVGVDSASSGFAYLLYDMLEAGGLTEEDYETVELGAPRQRLKALNEGLVQAVLLGPAQGSEAAQAGCTALLRAGDHEPAYPGMTVVSTRSFVEDHRGLVTAYVNCLRQALDWVRDGKNRSRVVAALAAQYSTDTTRAADMLDTELASVTRQVSSVEDVTAALQCVARLRQRWGGAAPLVEDCVDPQLLPIGGWTRPDG